MKRRQFLRNTGIACCATGLSASGKLFASPQDYSGRLLVTVQADGAWDVTSFCDPKMNVAGEPEINWWARTAETQTAGNIQYAPFANNASFFSKYRDYMMVINGVDTQTNAHEVGVLHSWSGRNSEGFPSLPAIMSAVNAPVLPLSYLNFGGFGQTADLVRSTRLDEIGSLRDVLLPNTPSYETGLTIRDPAANAMILTAQRQRLQRMLDNDRLMPRQRYNAESHLAALQNTDALERFADLLPGEEQLEAPEEIGETYSTIRQQAQVAVLAFRSGVAASADLVLPGFDTHNDHDRDHAPLLGALTDGIDYLWDYAEANGVADRLTVVVTSDFGRTPWYNSYSGKDHWPITSVVVMEKNAPWGNRVVGLTDEGHNAYRINPITLQRDDANGTIIYPKHVHKALREYLGLNSFADAAGFPFNNTESFNFFG